MKAVWIVAVKEFRDGLRNRWIVAITLIFCLLAVGLAYFGAAASGAVGFTSLPATIISLASLGVIIIPLIALLLAYDAIVGEDENGTLLLLLTYPLERGQLLLGKFLGHGGILAAATVLGFGAAALVISLVSARAAWQEVALAFAQFMVSAILLGWVFVAFAYLISVFSHEKSRAAGLALLTWFGLVLVFDLLLLGMLVITEGQLQPALLPYLLLLNPADVFRLTNLSGASAGNVYGGVLAMGQEVGFSVATLLGVQLLWVIIPLVVAVQVFKRRKI